MKRLIILMVLMAILVACGSTKDTEKEDTDEPVVKETEEKDETKEEPKEEEKDEEKDEEKKEQEGQEESKEEPKEEAEDEPVHKENNQTDDDKQATDENTDPKTDKKPAEKPEKAPEVKNEKVEVAAENIIQAQNNRDYGTLKGYLGQNITLNEKDNTLKITNVDYPHEAELLSDINTENIEHRFTQKSGKDHIVGFAVTDYETESSYTIDFTMRVGKDSWKMLNMQINK